MNLRNYKAIDIDAGGGQCSVAFSPNGKLLVTGIYGTEAKVWETATGQPVRSIVTGEIIGGLMIVFSPDGRLIAVGNRNAFTRVFEISSGETVCTLSKRASTDLKFNPDGKTLAIAYDDGSVAFWEVPNGKLVRSRGTSAEQIYSLDWSPDGSILVTAGLRGKITLWDTRDLSVVKELDAPEWVIQARFSPEGSRLFTAGGTQLPSPNRKVTVWGIDPGAGK